MDKLALGLLAELATSYKDQDEKIENIFVSPLSVSAALRLAQCGTTTGSDHETAMARVLGGPTPETASEAHVELPMHPNALATLVNSVWTRGDVLENYKRTVHELYGAEARAMPDSASPINSWVSEKTHEMIPSIIEDEIVQDPLVSAILVNAVHFKGSWLHQFDGKRTRQAKFHTGRPSPAGSGGDDVSGGEASGVALSSSPSSSSSSVPCHLMVKSGDMNAKMTSNGDIVVALPYGDNGETRAVFMLPKAPGYQGALDLAQDLPSRWSKELCLPRGEGATKIKVDLALPRFKIESQLKLKTPLTALGLGVCFSREGGFMRLSSDPSCKISQVIHRAVCEVNEEGTEAAAATAVVMKRRCLPRPGLAATFDRPFVFVIEGVSGRVLFSGVVANP